jgi:hypothetical protein
MATSEHLRDQVVHSEVESSTTEMSRAERQMNLHHRYGFYANTKDELTMATRLSASDDLVAGAASHLSHIQLHQEYASRSKDPSAAARKLTGDMVIYATTPIKDISFLRFLDQYIGDADPQTTIDTISTVSYWTVEPSVKRAIVDLLRYKETKDFVENDAKDHIGDLFSAHDKEANARIQAFIASLTVAEAQDMIKTRIVEHTKKSEFWAGHLQTIEKHYLGPVRAIAARALSTLKK